MCVHLCWMYCVPSPWWPWWQVCQACTEFVPSASVWGKPRRWLHLWCWPCPGTCSDRRELNKGRGCAVLTGVKCFIWPTNTSSCLVAFVQIFRQFELTGWGRFYCHKSHGKTQTNSEWVSFLLLYNLFTVSTSPHVPKKQSQKCRFNNIWCWDRFICQFGPFLRGNLLICTKKLNISGIII